MISLRVPFQNGPGAGFVNRAERFGQSIRCAGVGDEVGPIATRMDELSENVGGYKRQVASHDQPGGIGLPLESGKDAGKRTRDAWIVANDFEMLATLGSCLSVTQREKDFLTNRQKPLNSPLALIQSIRANDQRGLVATHAGATPSRQQQAKKRGLHALVW